MCLTIWQPTYVCRICVLLSGSPPQVEKLPSSPRFCKSPHKILPPPAPPPHERITLLEDPPPFWKTTLFSTKQKILKIISLSYEIILRITDILRSTPPPPKKKKKQKKKRVFLGGGAEFWDKIVKFWFYDIKKFLARIWNRLDLPATFRPISGHFRPIFAFWNPKICP